ncbi:hypothetical protein BE73_08070 [Xanthomonas oryzae pv. oryzicola]|nr:hypothetical protein BE73_08070 [Xanthomonas oryzae pv. oryzicola]
MRHACFNLVGTLEMGRIVEVEAFINGYDDGPFGADWDQGGRLWEMLWLNDVRNKAHPAEPAAVRKQLIFDHVNFYASA